MRKLFDAMAVAAVATIVALMVNALGVRVTGDHGRVTIGPEMKIAGQKYVSVDIANFHSKAINGLRISAPRALELNNLMASLPLKVSTDEAELSTDSLQSFEISQIEPETSTRLLVPLDEGRANSSVHVVNAKELRLEEQVFSSVTRPLPEAMKRAVPSSLINAVILALVYYIFSRYVDAAFARLKETQEQLNIDNEQLKLGLERAQERVAEDGAKMGRIRVLLLARMSDYSKELTFWRDTVRKMLYETTDKKDVEQLIRGVTEKLGTYGVDAIGTKGEYETIKAMSLMLRSAEELPKSLPKHE